MANSDLTASSDSDRAEKADLGSDDLLVKLPPTDGGAPLSYTQEQFWFLARLNPGSPIDNLPWLIDTPPALQVAALKRSLEELVHRHESLRTMFIAEEGRPVQRAYLCVELDLPVVSLEELPISEQERGMWRLIEAELRKPFDLERGPPFRAVLVRRSGGQDKLVLIVHHIAIDTFSAYNVLFPELISLYDSYSSCKVLPRLPSNLQMRHYALWQRQRAMAGAFVEDMRYWKRQLENLPAALTLPTDRPRPVSPSVRGAERSHLLPKELIDVLRPLGREEQATLFTVLLAAFFSILYRYTQQRDIFIGTSVADRGSVHKSSILGPLINMVVLRTDLSGDLTFRQVVRLVRDVLKEARDHSELPFEVLVNELRPQRNPGQNPLFQVAFNYLRSARADGWSITHRGVTTGTTNIDLIFDLQEVSEGIRIHAQYSEDLFEGLTIESMLQHYEVLLRGVVHDSQSPLWALPLLTDRERAVLNAWTGVSSSVPEVLSEASRSSGAVDESLTFPRLFELQVERSPEATALIFGQEELSYLELNSRANRLARRLRALGVGPESIAGICMDRGIDMIIALLAILKAGGAYVPLDPTYPAERLAYMLADSQPQVLITHKRFAAALPPHGAHVVKLDDSDDGLEAVECADLPPQASAGNLAYIIYTSGSTGRPKGVLIEHGGLSNLVEAQRSLFRIQPGSRVLQFASLSFDASIWEIAMALSCGAVLVLGTRESIMPGSPLLSFLHENGITVATLPPSALNALSKALKTAGNTHLPALGTIIVAGEACPPDLVDEWASGRQFFNAYGPTETTVCATVAECRSGDPNVLIGRQIRNMRCLLLDSHSQAVPAGVPGELYIEGVGLARGYHRRPDRTAERFLPSVGTSGGRMYRTGDLARYMRDGSLEFLGRADRQMKIRGFRIEPGEIELILRKHPDVLDTVVMSVKEAHGDARLVAYVACGPRRSKTALTEALKAYLSSHLPSYMVPSTLMILDEIPKTPAGKVDRGALLTAGGASQSRSAFIAPKGELETLISDVWRRVLGVRDVGVHDNFFDLGGNSLLLVRVHDALRTSISGSITMLQLFKSPTIRSLAHALSSDPLEEDASFVARAKDRARKQKLTLDGQRHRTDSKRRQR